jgi:hypothetical protein
MHHRIVITLIILALLFLGSIFFGPGFDEAVNRLGTAIGIGALIDPQPTPISVPSKL